jgi:hypothetical protein
MVKPIIRIAIVLACCSLLACAAVLGFRDRSGTWCTQHSHAFCEDFDDPTELAKRWPITGPPRTLMPTFETASPPNAAEFGVYEAGVDPSSDPNANPGTGFIVQALPTDLFGNHTKLAVGVEAQLVDFDPDASGFQGNAPFAPVLIIEFPEPNGGYVYGGVVLGQQDAGYWTAEGVRLIQALDGAVDISVYGPNGPRLQPRSGFVCTCVTLTMTDGGLTANASPGLAVPQLPSVSPAAVYVGLVEAPFGTKVAIDNVTIDYDQDCDPNCGH